MSIIDTAKELLKKGIALNDEELINMANSLLSAEFSFDDNEKATPPTRPSSNEVDSLEKIDVAKTPVRRTPSEITEQFIVQGDNAVERKRSVPVTSMERKNTFIDDLTEHKDVETPAAATTERKRPPVEKVKQTCSSCDKIFEVLPVHARDLYVCDNCVSEKTKGR